METLVPHQVCLLQEFRLVMVCGTFLQDLLKTKTKQPFSTALSLSAPSPWRKNAGATSSQTRYPPMDTLNKRYLVQCIRGYLGFLNNRPVRHKRASHLCKLVVLTGVPLFVVSCLICISKWEQCFSVMLHECLKSPKFKYLHLLLAAPLTIKEMRDEISHTHHYNLVSLGQLVNFTVRIFQEPMHSAQWGPWKQSQGER